MRILTDTQSFSLHRLKYMMFILPMIFYAPAVAAATLCTLFSIEERLLAYFNRHGAPAPVPRSSEVSPASLSPDNGSGQAVGQLLHNYTVSGPMAALPAAAVASSMIVAPRVYKNPTKTVSYWQDVLLKWGLRKSSGLGWNAGWFLRSHIPASMGSGLVFDLQPFFPFGKGKRGKSNTNSTNSSDHQRVSASVSRR